MALDVKDKGPWSDEDIKCYQHFCKKFPAATWDSKYIARLLEEIADARGIDRHNGQAVKEALEIIRLAECLRKRLTGNTP